MSARAAFIPMTVLSLLLASLALNAATQNAAPASAASKLAGHWRVNRDLTPMSDVEGTGQPGTPPGNSPGGFGGRGGGGRGRGGFGGRGGGFGGGRGGGREGGSQDDMLQMRALMRDLSEVPEDLQIAVTQKDVTIAADQSASRTFTTNGKKQKIDLVTAKVDVKTKWDHDVLDQEFTGGRLKVTETYQLVSDGRQLLVIIKPERQGNTGPAGANGRGQAHPLKRYYDRAGE